MRNPLLREAIRRGLRRYGVIGTAAALGSVALHAGAQDAPQAPADEQKLETITVTGSNIRRVDIETSNPVITVDKAQIQKSGKQTVGDLLTSLPTVAGSPMTPAVNNGGGLGNSLIDLRGLGTARTLTLVNGHRAVDPDVNTIPTNVIERIEILTDGASAVYGSDAIAGVINIILRSDYQGAEFSTNYGVSDRDDGVRKGVTFTFGHTTDRGSLLAGINYNKQDGVLAKNRDYGKNALYLYGGTVYAGGSSTGIYGNIQVPAAIGAQVGGCADGQHVAYNGSGDTRDLGNYHCYGQSDRFNFQAVGNLILTPQERSSAFAIGNYKLTDNVTAYLEVYHTRYQSASIIAPLPFTMSGSSTIRVSQNNYYNPFGVTFGYCDPAEDSPDQSDCGYSLGERMTSMGNRRISNRTDTSQIQAGFKGTFGESSWQWDANFGYGHTGTLTQAFGYFYQGALAAGLGPSFYDPTANGGAGAVVCGTPGNVISNCTPIDIFSQAFDPNVVNQLAPAVANPFTNVFAIERVYSASVNGNLFDLPAGTVGVAGGASYRKEYLNNQVDYIAIANASGNCFLAQEVCGSNLQGAYNVKEAYAEIFIPVLKDIPFIHSLNVTLGDRYSKYNTFGNTNNWKIGVEWRPIEDLLLRGTVSSVFRAPTIGNLYAGPSGGAPTARDPCENLSAAQLAQLPGCAGVPPFLPPAQNSQLTGVVSGSQYAGYPLGPESGKSFDFGVVYDPGWLEGLSVSSDVWRVYLTNNIVILDAQVALTSCAQTGTAFCQFIHRVALGPSTGMVDYISLPTVNLGRLDTRGVDFAAHYKLPEFAFGRFSIDLQTMYTAEYNVDPAPGVEGDVVNHVAGHYWNSYGEYSRWRAMLDLNWTLGNFDASWHTRYVGPFSMGSADLSQNFSSDTVIPGVVLQYGAQVVNNVQFGYNIEPINTRFDLGVDNVFDKQPPILYQNNVVNANTDPGTFYAEMLGRYYWGRVTVKF